MAHFRQDPLIDKHLDAEGGSFKYKFKGQEYEINQDTIDSLSSELIQSLSTMLSKMYPKAKIPKKVKGEGKADETKQRGHDDRKVAKTNQEELIKKELKRLATTEFMIEDKLNYPRVFMKLLSQPHLALEEKRLTVDEKVELYMYVDESVGYNRKDNGFHHTMAQVAQKIKGIHVYYSPMLRFKGDYYWDHMKNNVPKGKTVLVFTQGCGGSFGEPPTGYNIHFCTHFEKGDNCGCCTIEEHEDLGKLFHMNYGIDVPEKLKSLKIK